MRACSKNVRASCISRETCCSDSNANIVTNINIRATKTGNIINVSDIGTIGHPLRASQLHGCSQTATGTRDSGFMGLGSHIKEAW